MCCEIMRSDPCGPPYTGDEPNPLSPESIRCRFFLSVYALVCLWNARHFDSQKFEFSIRTTWDGKPIDHEPVKFTVNALNDDSLKVEVRGSFFNDPGSPAVPPGNPCPELWEYEVAEIFFLGAEDKYLEVEFCPHGQHLVLLLNGTRNMIKDKLPLEYTAVIDEENKTWKGNAIIPMDYFPPEVAKINAYAIHGSGECRQYEALYPATTGFDTPDFHRLQFFKDFNFKALFTDTWKQPKSIYWTASRNEPNTLYS